MSRKVLVIEDSETLSEIVTKAFGDGEFQVLFDRNVSSGVRRAATERPDLVLLDFESTGGQALAVLEQLKVARPSVPIVMLTGSQDVRTAVRAMQIGAFDYLTTPIDRDELVVVARRALHSLDLQLEVTDLRQRLGREEGSLLAAQMGVSALVEDVVEQVKIVAASKFTVLITGETGTGKELVAQAIHRQSARRQKPFVALDCGAIPEPLVESELFGHTKGAFTGADRRRLGLFRLAEEGTCFLDEMGNLALGLQAKLLRALETNEVQPIGSDKRARTNIRFVAATNHDLQAMVADGRFRSDLFFRLAQYTIALPPLRERREDIEYLANRFIEEASIELRRPVRAILPETLEMLSEHDWPGNVRELRNVVRQAVLRSDDVVIRPSALRLGASQPVSLFHRPRYQLAGRSLRETAEEAARDAERDIISETLRASHGNKTVASKALKTDYKTLHLKMKQLGIEASDFTG